MTDKTNADEGIVSATASDSQTVVEGLDSGKKKYSKDDAILADLVKERKARQELESRLQDIERQKLEAEGDKDKIIQALKKDLGDYKSRTATWIRSKVEDQVAMKAKDLGCIDTDLLMKTIDVEAVEIDRDTFRMTNPESVLMMLEEARKKKPFLFKQSGPEYRDGLPASKPAVKSNTLDYKTMKTSDIISMARKQAGLDK
jgi:hypothetical protein